MQRCLCCTNVLAYIETHFIALLTYATHYCARLEQEGGVVVEGIEEGRLSDRYGNLLGDAFPGSLGESP